MFTHGQVLTSDEYDVYAHANSQGSLQCSRVTFWNERQQLDKRQQLESAVSRPSADEHLYLNSQMVTWIAR